MRVAIVAIFLLLALPAQAETLRIGVPSDPTSMDPHFQDLAPNANIARHVFDALVATGSKSELQPGLATGWTRTADPAVWEITLRPGVKFHDGKPFSAEDAVFSLLRVLVVPNAPNTTGRYVRDLVEIAVVDPHTLRIRTPQPSAILPNNLSNVPIVSSRVGMAAEPRDFNNGTHMIGTGAYRFVRWTPGSDVALAANPDHWGGTANWSEVRIRTIPNNGARLAGLLSGDVDLISALPTTDVARLRAEGKFAVWDAVSNRDVFWSIDTARAQTPFVTSNDGGPIANPFRDIRVRQAVMLAINRKLIVERVMEGMAMPATQLVPIGMTGYDPTIALPEPDPARARALLAEAGYPQGFKLTIHTTAGRYPNDQQQAEAVAQMLSRVGIQTQVSALPVATYFVSARKHAFTFNLVSWGFGTGDTYVLVRETLHSRGLENYGSNANPDIDRALDQALIELDPMRRGQFIADAQRIAAADAAVIPTHYQLNLWASRRNFKLNPRMDELTLAQDISAVR